MTTDTKYDKTIKLLKNNKIIVIIILLFGFLGWVSVILDFHLKIKKLFTTTKIEVPVIDAKLIIDDYNDTCFHYIYEITNTSNMIAYNITYYISDPNMIHIEFKTPMQRDLTPNSSFSFNPSPVYTPISNEKYFSSFILIVKYEYDQKNCMNCFYRFSLSNNQLKQKEYSCETKNCQEGILSKDREKFLLKNMLNKKQL